METKAVSGIALALLLTGVLTSSFTIQSIKATGGVFIRADGSIDPPTVPIRRDGDVYTFTGNILDEIVVERSNIIVDGNGYTLQGSGSESGFHLEGISNVTIQNTNIQGFTSGVYLYSSSNNTISGNTITNNYLKGIDLYNSSEFNTISGNNITSNFRNMYISGSSGNTISGNTITNSDYDGVCLYWAPGNTISGNTMTDNYHSTSVYGSSGNTISGNTITNSSCGIDIYSASEFNTISGNTITNTEHGVHIYSTSNNIISENTLMHNDYGVHLYTASNNTVSENTLMHNDYDVHLSGSSGNTISGNTITNSNYTGVYLYDSSEFNTISGNTITKSNYNGIYLYWSPNNTIAGNTITNNDYDGIYFYWSYNNTIAGNTITNNFRGIFFWSSSGNTISGNTNTNNYDGMCIHGADTIISGNTLTNNDYGIALHGYGTIISGNSITNNNRYGISIYDSLLLPMPPHANMIFHNNLINNTNQIRLSYSSDMWDDDHPSGGNYWSDYNGTDNDGDGIGDTPYIIDETNQDSYPLMAPIYAFDAGTWEGTHYFVDLVSNSKVSDFYFNPPEGPFLRFSVTGPDDTLGFCRVTVPKGLLSAPDLWTVKVNGQAVTPNIIEDGENTYLYFIYSHSTKIVEIRGEEAKTEFPVWIPILLILIVLAVAIAALYKRRLSKTPTY